MSPGLMTHSRATSSRSCGGGSPSFSDLAMTRCASTAAQPLSDSRLPERRSAASTPPIWNRGSRRLRALLVRTPPSQKLLDASQPLHSHLHNELRAVADAARASHRARCASHAPQRSSRSSTDHRGDTSGHGQTRSEGVVPCGMYYRGLARSSAWGVLAARSYVAGGRSSGSSVASPSTTASASSGACSIGANGSIAPCGPLPL